MKKLITLLICALILLSSCGLNSTIVPEETEPSQFTATESELPPEPTETVASYFTELEGNSSLVICDNAIMFPEPGGIIGIDIDTLGAELPASKEDGDLPVMMTLTAGGATLRSYGQIKVQGTSTVIWPKKNWSLKFFADEARTEKLLIKIGDSIASDQWIAKAEWIDPPLLRSALSYRLWEAMVKSRICYPQYEVDRTWIDGGNMFESIQTGAQGFPKTYPVQVKVNGEHYGLSLLLLGHDPRNFNINTANPRHIYMEFDARGGYTDEKTWEKFSAEGIGQWIDGYLPQNEDFTEEQKAAINVLGSLINGSLDDFIDQFNDHLDKTNMIDMLLFMEAIYDYDAVAQDIEMVTYDLRKWYLLPWDKDTTFGMKWGGSGLIDDSEARLLINYEKETPSQKPWFKTYHAFTKDVEARYSQLRDEEIFSVQGLYEMAGDITKKIPKELWEVERDRWEPEGRPSLDETSTSQLLTWFEKRLETLDQHFRYSP